MTDDRTKILIVDQGAQSPQAPEFFEASACEVIGHVGTLADLLSQIELRCPDLIVLSVEAARQMLIELQQMKQGLEQAREDLVERKLIDRAKGLLMARNSLSEAQAYRALQKLAMDRKIKIAQVARNLLDTAELLDLKS